MERAQMLNEHLLPEGRYPRQLEIKQTSSPDTGLGLFTNEAIPASAEIISKTLMMTAVNEKHLDTTCDHCLTWLGAYLTPEERLRVPQDDANLAICGWCDKVYYCSTACRKEARRHHHKAECEKMLELEEEDLIAKLTFRLLANYQKGNQKTLENWPPLSAMQREEADPEIANNMPNLSALHGIADAEEVFKDLYARVKLNSRMLHSTVEYENIGITIDPLVGIINHSCQPNVEVLFEGTRVHVRSTRDIAAGEEITTTYTDCSAPRWFRQGILKEEKAFDCNCTKCREETAACETASREEQSEAAVKRMVEIDVMKVYTEKDTEEPQDTEWDLSELVGDGESWPVATIFPMADIYHFLARSYADQGDAQQALRYMLQVVCVANPERFPLRHDPLRVCQLIQLAMLIPYAPREDEYVPSIDYAPLTAPEWRVAYRYCMLMAARDVCASHGEDSRLAKALKHVFKMETGVCDGDWELALDVLQEMVDDGARKPMRRLLEWAGIPASKLLAIEN